MKPNLPVLLLAVALAGCGTNVVIVPSQCLKQCRGCCTLDGVCLDGTSVDACGAPGDSCVACGAGEVCAALACLPAAVVEPTAPAPDAGSPRDAGGSTTPDAGQPATPDAGAPADGGPCTVDGWCDDATLADGTRLSSSAVVRAVHVTAADDVWAVGDDGLVLRRDAAGWRHVNAGVTESLFAVWASGPADVWLAGGSGDPTRPVGFLVHFDGVTWTTTRTQTPRLETLWGRGPHDVFAAGTGGTVLHFDGSAWTPEATGTTKAIVKLHGTATRVWGVGEWGLIVARVGGAWQVEPAQGLAGLTSVLAFSDTDVVAVGGSGAVSRWNGTAWQAATLPGMPTMMAVWGPRPDALWSPMPEGTVLRLGAGQLRVEETGTRRFLRDLHGLDERTAWAVGFGGTVLRRAP